ncbi:hypothetical protein TNCV_3698171 [Trichonephila clavipes]|uniref:Uncharacterized protein n=1 Tax=Trichonephila clavipes TaxID=2585209 RepID=A0A8X6SEP3_TRICX|nr:hypothetical protein TNCV_3698171 [Trichonephila clavipes]
MEKWRPSLAVVALGRPCPGVLSTDPIELKWAENNSAGTVTDEVCPPKGRLPCLLRFDWPRLVASQKVGVEMDWVDPKINDPRQGDLE